MLKLLDHIKSESCVNSLSFFLTCFFLMFIKVYTNNNTSGSLTQNKSRKLNSGTEEFEIFTNRAC